MRVVVIADFAVASGGAPAVAILSAIGLSRRGVAVTFVQGVAGDADRRLARAGIEIVSLAQRDVWDLPAARAAASGIWNRDASRRLRERLRLLPPGPTILHLHQWTRAMSPSVIAACLGTSHPLAVTLHDYFMVCPNGVYYRFDRSEPCRLTPLSAACVASPCDPRSGLHKAVRVVRSAATSATIRRGGFHVIHVSDRGRDTAAPFLPEAVMQHRVDNPVEAVRAEPARIGPGSRIAFFGRLTREKGADLVAAAAEAAGMPALFVGEGPAEAEIRRLSPGAEILGWRPRHEVDEILRTRVRALAAPSRWYETGPLTVYEAMAAGVPVVASTRAGAAEKVAHGTTGLVVEPDVGALTDAFRALADDGTARRMGALAHAAYWAEPMDVDAHADHLLRLYERALAPGA